MNEKYQRTALQEHKIEDFILSPCNESSNSSYQLLPEAKFTSSCVQIVGKQFQGRYQNGSCFAIEIIYFQSKPMNHSSVSKHHSFLQNHNVDADQENKIHKYRIGNSIVPQYISESDLRRKHYQIIEAQEKRKQNDRMQRIYGPFPKFSKPIHRYFNPDKKCHNCNRRGHKTGNCTQQRNFFFTLLRSNTKQSGLIIEVDPSVSTECYDY